jgi:hypothetical protein
MLFVLSMWCLDVDVVLDGVVDVHLTAVVKI